jgi:hypothetical protein
MSKIIISIFGNLCPQKKIWQQIFSPLSFVAVLDPRSGIRDVYPGSATLIADSVAVPAPDILR